MRIYRFNYGLTSLETSSASKGPQKKVFGCPRTPESSTLSELIGTAPVQYHSRLRLGFEESRFLYFSIEQHFYCIIRHASAGIALHILAITFSVSVAPDISPQDFAISSQK